MQGAAARVTHLNRLFGQAVVLIVPQTTRNQATRPSMNYSPFQTIQATESRCFKLTPSMLTFLWDDCKRCFWLQARERIYRPRTPFPSVFTKYHEILQQHFEGRRPSSISPTLPRGRIYSSEAWVKSAPLDLPGLIPVS